MNDRNVLKTGVIGSVVAMVCCFTPVLVIALGFAGLTAWLGWLDYVLFPAMAVFLERYDFSFSHSLLQRSSCDILEG